MERSEAIKQLRAARKMLLGKDDQPVSDLYYALEIAIQSLEVDEAYQLEYEKTIEAQCGIQGSTLDWLYRLKSEVPIFMPPGWKIPMCNALECAIKCIENTKLLNERKAEDCISRQSLLDELEKWDWQELYLPIHFKENIIDCLPSVYPKSDKHFTKADVDSIVRAIQDNYANRIEDIKAEIKRKKLDRGDASESYGMDLAIDIIDKYEKGIEGISKNVRVGEVVK